MVFQNLDGSSVCKSYALTQLYHKQKQKALRLFLGNKSCRKIFFKLFSIVPHIMVTWNVQ